MMRAASESEAKSSQGLELFAEELEGELWYERPAPAELRLGTLSTAFTASCPASLSTVSTFLPGNRAGE